MQQNPETEIRDRKIAALRDCGYSTQEIYNMEFKNKHGQLLSKRYIQHCIKTYSPVEYYGKITDSRIFSLRDVENIITSPEKKQNIINKKIKDYYKKSNIKNLDIIPKNKSQYQSKLRALVFERDNFECTQCGSVLGLECHHDVYKEFESLEEELDCCKTLCYKCHREIHD